MGEQQYRLRALVVAQVPHLDHVVDRQRYHLRPRVCACQALIETLEAMRHVR